MSKKILTAFTILFFFLYSHVQAQFDSSAIHSPYRHDSLDLKDVIHHLFHKQKDSIPSISQKKYELSIIPAVGYTLQTGVAAIITANIAFKTGSSAIQKVSSISTSVTYSQYNQVIIPFVANIWSKANKFNLITDIRFIKYPSSIYGLGGRIDPNQGYTINFSGLKFHQTISKEVARNFSIGLGYYYDQFWDIAALDSLKQNIARRLAHKLGTTELSSGVGVKFLYDSRLNQVNPANGIYASVLYKPSFTFLGSDENWQCIQADVRAYIPFPKSSKNMLALWAFNWLSVGSNAPPYLLLPSTGWDDNYNSGRGYIQGRFRGKDMYYFESEYRFNLSRNGLFGGVVFGNAEKFSGDLSKTYTSFKPGYGLGLRIKVNKHSGANICLDYGFGNNGSKGFSVNLGEVF